MTMNYGGGGGYGGYGGYGGQGSYGSMMYQPMSGTPMVGQQYAQDVPQIDQRLGGYGSAYGTGGGGAMPSVYGGLGAGGAAGYQMGEPGHAGQTSNIGMPMREQAMEAPAYGTQGSDQFTDANGLPTTREGTEPSSGGTGAAPMPKMGAGGGSSMIQKYQEQQLDLPSMNRRASSIGLPY